MVSPDDSSPPPSRLTSEELSIFAIGLVSVNFARFEFALTSLLGTVVGLTPSFATKIVAKVNNDVRFQLIEERLQEWDWPDPVKDIILHFIKGARVLIANRNLLIHSNLTANTEVKLALYRTNRKGETIICSVTSEELFKVASEIDHYFSFGLKLATSIEYHLTHKYTYTIKDEGRIERAPFPLPEKPPLPVPLDYKSLS